MATDLKEACPGYARIAEWLKTHHKSLYDAIGCWPVHDETMVLVLSRIPKFINGRLPLFKEPADRHRDEILHSFLKGEPVDDGDLKTAIALLLQSYSAAMDAVGPRYPPRDRPKAQRPDSRPTPW